MDRRPAPGSFVSPPLIELQHLIPTEGWRLIYMIQVQSQQRFFNVKDSYIWHVRTESTKDQNGAQENNPQIRGFAVYCCVLAQQLCAPYKMVKWSLAKEKKKGREKKKKACNTETALLIQGHVALFEHTVVTNHEDNSASRVWSLIVTCRNTAQIRLTPGMAKYKKSRLRRTQKCRTAERLGVTLIEKQSCSIGKDNSVNSFTTRAEPAWRKIAQKPLSGKSYEPTYKR